MSIPRPNRRGLPVIKLHLSIMQVRIGFPPQSHIVIEQTLSEIRQFSLHVSLPFPAARLPHSRKTVQVRSVIARMSATRPSPAPELPLNRLLKYSPVSLSVQYT